MKYLIVVCAFVTTTVSLALGTAVTLGDRSVTEDQIFCLAIFRSPSCTHCESVEPAALEKLGRKLGCKIELKIYDIDDIENYRLLLKVEKALGDEDNEFPIVVVGNKLLAENTEIVKGLEQAIRDAIAAGKTGLPEVIARVTADTGKNSSGFVQIPGKPVYAAFFSQGGCTNCDRILASLRYLKARYPSFDCRIHDTRNPQSARLFEAVCQENGVPEADRRKNPGIFLGQKYLLEKDVTPSAVEKAIGTLLDTGTGKPWEATKEALDAAQQRILARFRALGPMTVVAAGLIDGINPCAFATIVFFVTYLAATGRGRREILVVGLTFSAAVFGTYFAVGFGALEAITRLRVYGAISKAIDITAATAAIVFGGLSLWDYFKARRGRIEDMHLVLPGFLKKRINVNISRQLRLRGVIIGALAAGVLVSVFELACTGQVYLPALALISGDVALRARAVFFLTLYNLMFILPLLAILGMVNFGLGQGRLTAVFQRNIAAGKLALALMFFALGGAVVFNLLAH